MSLKRKVFNQDVLPVLTWFLTKALVKKLEISQKSYGKENAKRQTKDRIRNTVIWQRIRMTDKIQYVANAKWKWAGHIARTKDNRWTITNTD